MRGRGARAWGGLLGVLLATAAHAAPPRPAAPPVARSEAPGRLELRLDARRLRQLGLRPEAALRDPSIWPLRVETRALRVELGDGAPTRVTAGLLEVPQLRLRRGDGARTPELRLDAAEGLGFEFKDARDRVWLRLGHAMRSPDPRDGLRLFTAELRVGPALAQWVGARIEGELLGGAGLQVPLTAAVKLSAGKSCSAPNWPGTPGYVADVVLTNIDSIQAQPGRCRNLDVPASPCDGPGGNEGELVIVPSATLRNRRSADAAEIPWYQKFSGTFPPYGNDQHPYLVWNLYRLDGDGRIEQIGRSGLKHAFATANSFCDEPCFNGHILGRGCSDLYDASSNDCASFLGPRRDVIPSRGIWARCGSLHDPDCDGIQGAGPPNSGGFCSAPNSSPAGDGFSFRLVVRESALDPALHPGSRYLLDAWYVVRDDADPYNTMGWREIFPSFAAPSWDTGVPTPFVAGPPLDAWLAAAPAGTRTARFEASSAEGRALVGVRIAPTMDGRWRYDYAIANVDFSRPVLDGATAEPNLRMLRNLGFGALALELREGATADSFEYRDGDPQAANDWSASTAAEALRWEAPAGATLDWGQLVFLRVVSSAAPGAGALALEIAEPGADDRLVASVPVPDAAQLFRDSFE